jgi:bacterioferritin
VTSGDRQIEPTDRAKRSNGAPSVNAHPNPRIQAQGTIAQGTIPGNRKKEDTMAKNKTAATTTISVADLIDALNEDLSREYQAIIAYTVYSSVLSGAQWMNIAAELKLHAAEELQHALILADQIDYLGGSPTATPKPVKLSKKAEDMLRFDLDNETETIRNYRQRVKQAEALGHYALSELLRTIIVQEQNHQHDLATALGIDVPKVLDSGA